MAGMLAGAAGGLIEMVQEMAPHLLEEVGLEGLEVATEQKFDAYLEMKKFRIEREKLYREDLRDLVELTVGRMDIYHLVGALLLEFCIHFYCESEMLRHPNVPRWVLALFLLSNLQAVGYLIFSVWLAMHASVAAHSTGVRLLVSVQRLTIPEDTEVQSAMVKRIGRQLAERWRGRKKAAAAEAPVAAQVANSASSHSSGRSGGPTGRAGTSSTSSVDRWNDHFRTFDNASSQWRGYDENARLCMSMGMSQMLQALSYYISGTLALDCPVAALCSLVGVQWLQCLLLNLDITDDPETRSRDLSAVGCLIILPQVIACVLLNIHTHAVTHAAWEARVLQYISTFCFLLHAGWLSFVCTRLTDLQTRLRAARYIGVLNPQQLLTARQNQAKRLEDVIRPLERARKRLESLIGNNKPARWGPLVSLPSETWFHIGLRNPVWQSTDQPHKTRLEKLHGLFEAAIKAIPPEAPSEQNQEEQELQEDALRADLLEKLAAACEGGANEGHPPVALSGQLLQRLELRDALLEVRKEVQAAEQQDRILGSLRSSQRGESEALTRAAAELWAAISRAPASSAEAKSARVEYQRLELWRRAPRILAEFKALQSAYQTNWTPDSHFDCSETFVQDAFDDFLCFCHDLGLGIECMQDKEMRAHSQQPVTGVPFIRVQLPEEAMSWTHMYCWLHTSGRHDPRQDIRYEPTDLDTITCDSFFDTTLPVFLRGGEAKGQTASAAALGDQAQAPLPQVADVASFASSLAERRASLVPPPSFSGNDFPDMSLPSRLVYRLTAMGAILWLFAALAMNSRVLTYGKFAFDQGEPNLDGHHHALMFDALTHDPAVGLPSDGVTRASIDLHPVATRWPEPAGFFQVTSLFCAGEHLLVGNRFALYAGTPTPQTRDPASAQQGHLRGGSHDAGPGNATAGAMGFRRIGAGGAASVLCEGLGSHCSSLTRHGAGDLAEWRLAALPAPVGLGTNRTEAVPVPASWKRISASWAPCTPAPCEAAWLAGWDGLEVVVAAAWRSSGAAGTAAAAPAAAAWRVEERFAVRPSAAAAAACPREMGGAGCEGGEPSEAGYTDVRALQVSANAHRLSVLHQGAHGTLLDGWDLESGSFLGQWALASSRTGRRIRSATAMCHDGARILVADGGSGGSASLLEEGALPPELADAAAAAAAAANAGGGGGAGAAGAGAEPVAALQ